MVNFSGERGLYFKPKIDVAVKGSDDYFSKALVLIHDCNSNEDIVSILREVWLDGVEYGKAHFETLQPDSPFDYKHDYDESDGVWSSVYWEKSRGDFFKQVIPNYNATNFFGLKICVEYAQRVFWKVEKDNMLYKIVVKRRAK